MALYNYERFSVFFAEDNQFVRHTMQDLLRHLGFGRVTTVENGQEAIEHLKSLGGPGKLGQGIDFVISDLVMAPINGLLLLRWIRTARESPNRFMPFIMLSGAADRKYVEAARDLGVTEFLAKPFSVTSVYKKIIEVTDYPRQYVMTHDYFGPDRRRQKGGIGPGGEDRRMTRENDITVVYNAKEMKRPKKGDTGVWYFRLPNTMREKAGGIGARGGGELPNELLEVAEEKLERAKLDFTTWALDYLAQLSDLCTETLMQPGRRNTHFEKINLLALELRGQGGTFGFPLVTIIAKGLYNMTQEGCREDDNAVEIVKAHIDAMRAVIREKIRGDGGPLGKELLQELKNSIDKYTVVA